ncbi:uncharacterized protein LAESUDRAFT_792023, partial [Laetiporus sulphureus 93-53]
DILACSLPYDPHDYQLEGVAKALKGTDVVAITPTGSGKTGFFIMYLLVAHAFAQNPSHCPIEVLHHTFKASPCYIIHAPKFMAIGLSVLVINSDTTQQASHRGENLWKTALSGVEVILLMLEQLMSKGFECLLADKSFSTHVMTLGVDKIHLLQHWGMRFRAAFKQIGSAHMQFPGSPVIIALTVTLCPGLPTESVCGFLGLKVGQYHQIHHLNARYDIE